MTCLGKIVGGGLPAAAYGGSRDIMSLVAPAGPVYQAGTLSGNPLAMAAGAAATGATARARHLRTTGVALGQAGSWVTGRRTLAGVPIVSDAGRLDVLRLLRGWPCHRRDPAKRADTTAYATYFQAMLEEGVYLAPSQFEAGFMSLAHSEEDIARTIDATSVAFERVQKARQA